MALRSIRGFVKEDVVVEGSGADSHRPRTSGCWPSSAILLILHGHVETYFHTLLSDMKDAVSPPKQYLPLNVNTGEHGDWCLRQFNCHSHCFYAFNQYLVDSLNCNLPWQSPYGKPPTKASCIGYLAQTLTQKKPSALH